MKKEELKELIKTANSAKDKGEPLTGVFRDFAIKFGKAKGSVRNAYYQSLSKAEKDEDFKNEYFSEGKPKVNKIIEFEKIEAEIMLEKILVGATFGKSIRKAVRDISPDERTAMRYQNKYRNMLKTDRKTVEKKMKEIELKYGNTFDPYKKPNGDEALDKLKSEIDGLVKRISESTKRENERLKSELEFYKKENEKLQNNAVHGLIGGYFNKNNEQNTTGFDESSQKNH